MFEQNPLEYFNTQIIGALNITDVTNLDSIKHVGNVIYKIFIAFVLSVIPIFMK